MGSSYPAKSEELLWGIYLMSGREPARTCLDSLTLSALVGY